MDFFIDRDLPVPIRQQLIGMIAYGIACGDLQVGQSLPSVRELAEQVGVAPMTVSLVYRDLKKDGLIDSKPGSGTYVADSSQARMAARADIDALHRQIDALIDNATAMGIRSSDVASLFNARLAYRLSLGQRVSVVIVGLFPDATASYARVIAAQIGSSATVEPMTIDAILRNEAVKHRAGSADLVMTFANRHREVSALLPNTKVVSIRFIPSEATRMALAALDPMARVAVVSLFHDFLPIIKAGVQRFAAHVQDIAAVAIDDPEIGALLASADVVVFSTGAEAATEIARPGMPAIEYRHSPDPGDIERVVMPFITTASQQPAVEQKEAS